MTTIGERAYRIRQEERASWMDIQKRLGSPGAYTCAKSYARLRGLPWPLPGEPLVRKSALDYLEQAVWEGDCLVVPASIAQKASRLVAAHENGPCPEGMVVDHICENRRCIRLDHLRWATHTERVRAFRDRTRGCKISRKDAEDIRAAVAAGVSGRELAGRYGVSDSLISLIRSRRRWP